MNSRRLACAALPLALLLTSCAGRGRMGAPVVGGGVPGAGPCHSPLRVCMIQGPGRINNLRMNDLRETFASAVHQANPTPAECDIVFSFPATFSDRAEVTSAFNGRSLGRFGAQGCMVNVQAACNAFADERGELFNRIPGEDVLARRPQAAALTR